MSWHLDPTYWGLDPDDVVTAWVAFTDATPENGYMQFITGTHMIEQLPHLDTFHRDNLLSRGQEIAVEVDRSKAVGIALKAGEMSLHHIKLVMAPSPERQRRPSHRPRDSLYPHSRSSDQGARLGDARARHDKYHHFDDEPRPRADLDDAAKAAHADAVNRQVKALYQGTDEQGVRA